MTISTDKKQLIEEIGLINEERFGLTPLAARIYALLSLSSNNGLTFEEIREIIKASKSSISVNINVLLQLNCIEYFTKSGDRKRYFRTAKRYHLQSLNASNKTLEKEIEILQKLNDYNKTHHPEKFKKEKSLGTILEGYFKAHQELIKKTIKKIDDF